MSAKTGEKSLAEQVQCPVCLAFPSAGAPIYGCQNGHIICQSCQPHVHHCPICRSEKFNVRNVLAESLLVSPVFKCPYSDNGCNQSGMTAEQYTNHVKECDYREIECHCKLGNEQCFGTMVPKIDYMDHMRECHGAQKTTTVRCDMGGSFTPTLFSCFGEHFLLMSHKNEEGTRFWTWIAQENNGNFNQEFFIKLRLRYQFGPQEVKLQSDVFSPSKTEDTPDAVLKSGHCMEFSATTAPQTMPPMVWPGFAVYIDDQPGFIWGYDVEVTERLEERRGRISARANPIAAVTPRPTSGPRAAPVIPTPPIEAVNAQPRQQSPIRHRGLETIRQVVDNVHAGIDQIVNQLNDIVHTDTDLPDGMNQILHQLDNANQAARRNADQLLNELNNMTFIHPIPPTAAIPINNANLQGNEPNHVDVPPPAPLASGPVVLAEVEDGNQGLHVEGIQELEDYSSSSEDEAPDRDDRIRTAENRSRSPSPPAKRVATGEDEEEPEVIDVESDSENAQQDSDYIPDSEDEEYL